jgi:hypothetical protein
MSKWTEHVKAYAEKHKVSYKQAMRDAAASYEKGEKKVGEKKESKPREPKEKKEPKTKHEKAETPMMEKAEHKDGMKVAHEKKKREGAAASLKPRKLAQLG